MRVNADSPWQDPSSTGPVEGGDPPEKQGWVPKGVRTQTGNQRDANQGHPPPTDTTPHHPRFPGGAVEGGGGPRKGWRAWGGRFPARSPTVPWTGRPWVQGWVVSRLRRDPNVTSAPTIPRGIQWPRVEELSTRGHRKDRGRVENDPWLRSKSTHPPHPPPPYHGEKGWEWLPPGLPADTKPWGFGATEGWDCPSAYEPAPTSNRPDGRGLITPLP